MSRSVFQLLRMAAGEVLHVIGLIGTMKGIWGCDLAFLLLGLGCILLSAGIEPSVLTGYRRVLYELHRIIRNLLL